MPERGDGTVLAVPGHPDWEANTSANGSKTPSFGTLPQPGLESWKARAKRNLTLTDPALLRGSPSGTILRSCASVLSSRPCTAAYYRMSMRVDAVDVFISHNWDTPRWRKFLVLCLHFNLHAAVATSLLVASAVGTLNTLGVMPIAEGISPHGYRWQRGYLAGPSGLLAFFATIFMYHEVRRFLPWRGHMVFLDKLCVKQTDPDMKQEGIRNLGAFLQSSHTLVVLYSDVYLQKLWTTYEIGAWLMMQRGDSMIVWPLAAALVLDGGVLLSSSTWLLLSLLGLTAFQELLFSAPVGGTPFLLLCIALPIFYCWSRFVAKWAEAMERIDGHVSKFRVASARTQSESDRVDVQKNIVAFMKQYDLVDHAASDSEVLGSFEDLVRSHVPLLLRRAFGRAGVPYLWLVIMSLPRIFFGIDLDSWVLEHWALPEPRWRVFHLVVFELGAVFCILPLSCAVALHLTRHPRFRSPLACIGVAVLSLVPCTIAVSGTYLLASLSMGHAWGPDFSLRSSHAQLLHLGAQGLLLAMTCMTFRPLPAGTRTPDLSGPVPSVLN